MLNSHISETPVLAKPQSSVGPVPERTILAVRLGLGWTVLLGALTFLLGTCWDIQWHADVGRDRTLTAPHLVMLAGIALSGIAALTAILAETCLVRRNRIHRRTSTSFANLFQSSLGAYIAGFAALEAAIAFPLDSYWHTIYGIDVALFAPFHFMFIVGMGVVTLGACYMLVSAGNLARSIQSPGATRAANWGIAFGFVIFLGHFLLYGQSVVSTTLPLPGLPGVVIHFYPVLMAFIAAIGLIAARQMLPWRASATIIGLIFLLLDIIVFLMVPVLVNWLVGVEQLIPKNGTGATRQVIAASVWPQTLPLAGLVVDLVAWYASRQVRQNRTSNRLLTGAVFGGIGLTICVSPLFIIYLVSRQGLGPALLTVSISLPFAVLAAWAGRTIGQIIGESMKGLER